MGITIHAEAYDAPVVQALVQEMADDLARYYGPGTYPPQDPARWAQPEGLVLFADLGDRPAGCGAYIRFDPTTVELKRMYTRPEHRGQGVGAAILAALECHAVQAGHRRAVPPHDTDPTSVCFARDLVV